jgi:peptidyl-prolyl cis-trans isomerase D
MFNVFRSRDKFVRITLGAILTVVAVTMVITLIPGFGTTTGSNGDDPVLAQIGSQKILASTVQRDFQTISRTGQIPAEMMEVYFPQYFDAMVHRKAARYQAERMGLTVTDDEVLTGLMSADPQFFQNGQLVSKDQFIAFLAQQGLTLDEAIDDMKTDLLVRKLTNAMLESIVVTPKEVENEFNHKYEKAKIEYIAFPAAKFVDEVKPTDQEIQQYFNANKNGYTIPQKLAFQVLVLQQDKVEAGITLTDQQLRSAYSAALDNFRMPERVHVRHILISTEGKSDAEKKTLKTKAEDVLKQAKSGADFAALATKYSDDKANANKGGDLDWVVKGQMVPEFEAAAFALKPNEIGGVVTTQFGYHIIQVVGREPARVKPFDEVKDGLAVDLKKQTVADRMQMLGDQMHAALEKNPGNAAEIAKQYGADLVTVPKASPGEAIPTLGNAPEIEQALASMKTNDVSQVIALPADRLAIAVLNSRTPTRPADYSEVADQVKQSYVTLKSQDIAQTKAKEAADKIRAGEDMQKVAKSYKLDVTSTNFFSRDDAVEGLGSAAYVQDAFSKPEGTVLGPGVIQGRNVVYKVVGKQEADKSKFEAEKADLLLKLKQQKAQERNPLFLDSILSKLESEGKAKVYNDAVTRVVASYRQK